MAIVSIDNLIAGLLPPEHYYKAATTGEAAGVLHSSLYLAGRPGAGVAPSPGLAGAALTTYAGQIPFPASVGGKNIHLAGFASSNASSVAGIMLCDRLWHNSGLIVTNGIAQTVNSVTWPARDENGSTNGVGIMIGIEFSTIGGNGVVSNTTMSYTNDAGTAGRTATIASVAATAAAGSFYPFLLQAGDTGVRSIQSVTLGTSYVSGVMHLVAYRVVAMLPTPTINTIYDRDAMQLGMPRMYDNSVPFFLYMPTSVSIGIVAGQVIYAQG